MYLSKTSSSRFLLVIPINLLLPTGFHHIRSVSVPARAIAEEATVHQHRFLLAESIQATLQGLSTYSKHTLPLAFVTIVVPFAFQYQFVLPNDATVETLMKKLDEKTGVKHYNVSASKSCNNVVG